VLTVSDNVMGAFHAEGRRTLRPFILKHWWEDLKFAGEAAGEAKRNLVLNEVQRIAREEPKLEPADLSALADLMLVNAAAPPGSPR
jgi:hypothetical protein